MFELKLDRIKALSAAMVSFAIWLLLIKLDITGVIAALLGIITLYICMQYDLVIRIFKRFGSYSLQLYLFNGYFLVISRTVIVIVLGVENPFVIIAFNVLVDFFISYMVIKYICEKLKPIRFLTGMINE